jgi:hypothetical protein
VLALDPALEATLRSALALLFAAAAVHKLRDPAAVRAALAEYGVLPGAAVAAGAALVVAAEAGAALALLAPMVVGGTSGPGLRAAGPLLAAALLALYGAAIGWNLARGRRALDCGCLGPGRGQPLSGWLVARNLALVGGALACLLPAAPRQTVWLDGFTAAAATALGALVWSAAHQVLANAARSGALRGAA